MNSEAERANLESQLKALNDTEVLDAAKKDINLLRETN